MRSVEIARARRRLEGPPGEAASAVTTFLHERALLTPSVLVPSAVEAPGAGRDGRPAIAVLLESGRDATAAELIAAGMRLAEATGGHVVALVAADDGAQCGVRAAVTGADHCVQLVGSSLPDDVVSEATAWALSERPWAMLASGTLWGRELASRLAVRLDAGVVGDAIELSVEDGRLVAWKPAFGGAVVAAITSSSDVQIATVRPGVIPLVQPGTAVRPQAEVREVRCRARVTVTDLVRDDDVAVLATASVVVGVGSAVPPDEYPSLDPLLSLLGAELGATRKVTDRGWLPRSRQIGITGRSISPRLYVAIGLSGRFNHMAGVRAAEFVVAINSDPDAPVFDAADLGVVGDWREVVPALVEALAATRVVNKR